MKNKVFLKIIVMVAVILLIILLIMHPFTIIFGAVAYWLGARSSDVINKIKDVFSKQ